MLERGNPTARPRRPFHWPAEFPEVFMRERPGFDAVVGNPPFRGGKRISGLLGTDYRQFLLEYLADGKKGVADLVTYFFLRATGIVRREGLVALLATNTISQGDTREVGLDQILRGDWVITRAWKSRPWPGDASVQIAEIWLHRGEWAGTCLLDGQLVTAITSYLDPRRREQGAPNRLSLSSGKAFIGSLVNGAGFIVTRAEADGLIAKDGRNADVVFPYLIGDDLNNRVDQSPSRWVINFFDWPLERAEEYPDCLEILRLRAKPKRDLLPDTKRRERERWWQFERRAVDLYRTVKGMSRVVGLTRTNKMLVPAFVATGIVYSDGVVVFAYEDDANLGMVTSSLHWWWSVTYTSTLETRIRYTPSDCFETWPQPPSIQAAGAAARALDAHRLGLMEARGEGLTKVYNGFHDPNEKSAPFVELRRLHETLDYAVAEAYGWRNLDLSHGFHETSQGIRYTLGPLSRVEVLDRLLQLNHDRYRGEVDAGLHPLRRDMRAGV
jgi:hypothetical protein